MDNVEDNKDRTNQTGSKGPITDDLFKHVYFWIAVLIVGHDDGLTVSRMLVAPRLRAGCGNCHNRENILPVPAVAYFSTPYFLPGPPVCPFGAGRLFGSTRNRGIVDWLSKNPHLECSGQAAIC